MSQAEYFTKPLPVLSKLADVLRHFPAVKSVFARVAALWRGTRSRGEPPAAELPDEAPAVTERTVDPAADVVEPRAVTEPTVDLVAEVVAPATVTERMVEPLAVALQPPAVPESAVEQIAVAVALAPPAVTESPVDRVVVAAPSVAAIAEPETDPRAAREELIRRRWAETGIKMWNPDVQGAGHGALSIQGGAALLPPKPGETLPRYDRLEFRMVRSETGGQKLEQIVCEGMVVDPPKRKPRR